MFRSYLAATFVAATLFAPTSSEAAVGIVMPDLKVLSIGPSPLGTHYVRVVVANVGFGWSGSCALRLTASNNSPAFYQAIPALAPPTVFPGTSTKTLDVYVSVAIAPGTEIHAVADSFNEVAESKEYNNDLWYVAPPA